MTAMPFLPVDSATSCSSQAPSGAMPGDATIVSLSRPALAASPMTTPSATPGLVAASSMRQAAAICDASSRSRATSMPTSEAGTVPNADSTEKRPPTVGSPNAIARKPSRSATFCICEPGSVIATT